jgi:TPR repeat protein
LKRILLLCVLALPLTVLGQTAAQTKAQGAKTAERKPPSQSTTTPPKPEPLWLSPQQAAARYQEAVKAEGDGYHRRAFVAYLEAAENGHGFAQRKMGDLYSATGPVVKRDYQIALRWYEKARAQGVPIPKPAAFTKGY